MRVLGSKSRPSLPKVGKGISDVHIVNKQLDVIGGKGSTN